MKEEDKEKLKLKIIFYKCCKSDITVSYEDYKLFSDRYYSYNNDLVDGKIYDLDIDENEFKRLMKLLIFS